MRVYAWLCFTIQISMGVSRHLNQTPFTFLLLWFSFVWKSLQHFGSNTNKYTHTHSTLVKTRAVVWLVCNAKPYKITNNKFDNITQLLSQLRRDDNNYHVRTSIQYEGWFDLIHTVVVSAPITFFLYGPRIDIASPVQIFSLIGCFNISLPLKCAR